MAGFLAISAFWNGIVAIFICVAISSTLNLSGVRIPEWMPRPIMNDAPMTWGNTVCLWLFLLPFMLIGLAMLLGFATSVAGRVEIATNGSMVTVFQGVGPVGRRRRFETSQVKSVSLNEKLRTSKEENSYKTVITIGLNDGRNIDVGSGLSRPRMHFVASALHATLIGKTGTRSYA